MLPTLIKPIIPSDDPVVCEIIRRVGIEYGAVGEGFGPSDPEVTCMSKHYQISNNSQYLVAQLNNIVVGGCGIAPFNNSPTTCELKKLFLLPESRGLALGQQLVTQSLNFAKAQGFKTCYLDTLSNMTAAIALYEKLGFVHRDAPLAGTQHNACDVWMIATL